MAQSEVEPGTGGGSSVHLGGKYDILPGQPLEELRQPNAPAFLVTNRERASDQLFALVCSADLPPRREVIEALCALHVETVLTPVTWGVVDWPIGGRRSFVIVFDRPIGRRLVTAAAPTIDPVPEDDLLHNVLPPLVASLRPLFSSGLTHRAIRPSNLFYRYGAGRQIMLGECVSAPPAALQPVAAESIESGMAIPVGRGPGIPADDLYALGFTLMFLLLGRDPTAGIADDRLLVDKINRGSYSALLGGARLPPRLIEPIRGLLADDPRERWTLQDLDLWLQGRRIAPKQLSFPKRAARPFEFLGEPYFAARSLAHAFAREPAAAVRAIKGQDFDIWLQRSLSDSERTAAVATALSEAHETGGLHEGRLAARVCIALDPFAPVRYNDIAIAIDGFGTALVAAFCGRGSVQAIAQALAFRLPQFWLSAQAALRPEQVAVLKSVERLRIDLDDRRPGFGVERILYELNPGLHCLSPLVERDFILDPAELLPALERAAKSGRIEETIIDRQIAAFVAARFRGAGTDWHDLLGSGSPHQRALGTLQVLARLQEYHSAAPAPALGERLARVLPPLAERYHNRPHRARIKEKLAKAAPKGNFIELLLLLDNDTEQRTDAVNFAAARQEYAKIQGALGVLDVGAPARPQHASELGGRLSVTMANVLAWGMAVVALMIMS